ncbi:HTH domain-containing protein [Anaerobacillus sp. HL2]|nr:HTH domain-containing protein [Anaerobacillus sp. HL2]
MTKWKYWCCKTIAKEIGVSRPTISNYLKLLGTLQT